MKVAALFAIAVSVIVAITAVNACNMAYNGGAALHGCWVTNYVVNGTQLNMCAFDKNGNNYCKISQFDPQGYPGLCVSASAISGVPSNQWFYAGTTTSTECPRCPPAGYGRGVGCGGTGSPACGGGSDLCNMCKVTYFGPGAFTSQCA